MKCIEKVDFLNPLLDVTFLYNGSLLWVGCM